MDTDDSSNDQPAENHVGSSNATGPGPADLTSKSAWWKKPYLAVFIIVFAGIGAYVIFNSSADTQTLTKTWSTAADWDSGTLSDTVVAPNSSNGNSSSLALAQSKTVSSVSTTTTSPDLALGKACRASSASYTSGDYGKYLPCSSAFDGNLSTRWSSNYSNNQWISVNLGAVYNISEVKLNWETAYATAYDIQVSNNDRSWTTIYSTTTGKGGINDLTGLKGSGQYVRMLGITRATQWGYSLWEMDVYGTPTSGTTPPVTVPPNEPVSTSYDSSGNIDLTFNAGSPVTWSTLAANTTLSSGTSVSYEARTSTNGTSWSGWTNLTGSNTSAISLSALATSTQYIELQANLATTNSSDTPYLNSLTLTYTATIATPTATLSASPTSVTSGSTSTLSWSSTNASSCTASGGWSGTKATSGQFTTSALSATTSYGITCSGSGGSANASTSVTVTAPPTGTTGGTPPSSSTCGSESVPSSITPSSGMSSITNYTTLEKDYEFTGSSLPSGWTTGIYNYGNAATQYATSQVKFTSTGVDLVAQAAGQNGAASSSQGLPYVSGMISTGGSYELASSGRVDFCAQTPAGQGLWPGLWMDGGTQVFANGTYTSPTTTTGEIDVMEMLLGSTSTVYGSVHSWNGGTQNGSGETQDGTVSNSSTGFHDYSVVWQPSLITWSVDGKAYAQYSESSDSVTDGWPFQNEYIIADLNVAGSNEWGGPPNSSTISALESSSPPTLKLAWVKVWQ